MITERLYGLWLTGSFTNSISVSSYPPQSIPLTRVRHHDQPLFSVPTASSYLYRATNLQQTYHKYWLRSIPIISVIYLLNSGDSPILFLRSSMMLLKKLKSQGCLMCLRTDILQCLEGEAAICGTRLLSVSTQVGAHLWHEGPTGGLLWDSNAQLLNTSVCRGICFTTGI